VYTDFYGLESVLTDDELKTLNSVRDFMRDEITPIINDAWTRARFPFEILPAYKHLGIADLPYSGARARRRGDEWVLDGEKKWIGNATFADLVVIWARDVADDQVKGFVVEKDTPGFTTEKLEDKIALRVVQNAHIRLTGVRVPEENRLQNANSFRDTAKVLRATRAGVAWMAVGCALGAYENALEYAKTREQFGRPIGGFQLVQDLLVRMLGNTTASATLCVQLARLQEAGAAHDEHSALAKAYCTMRMRESVGWARELLGGNGILLEHNVGRFVADAEAIYSYEGTREMNTLIVGKAITGLSAFV
jgi:glutaryl-CoA dehydrogenase